MCGRGCSRRSKRDACARSRDRVSNYTVARTATSAKLLVRCASCIATTPFTKTRRLGVELAAGPEVHALMRLLERFLRTELASCVRNGVRIEMVGRRDRLSPRVRHAIEAAERETAMGAMLCLRLAIDYSSRDEIVRAAAHGMCNRDSLARRLWSDTTCAVPDVDLLIRTGGERRLSDFLLWESAYAELDFTDVAWPDFDENALVSAVGEFGQRQRRFGGLPGVARIAAVAS